MAIFSKKLAPTRNAYAVVTGAGSGIGRSFAVELAKRGGKACIKMGGAEKAKRSRQAKKSARKSKKKRAAANRKRAKSLKKRKSMVR